MSGGDGYDADVEHVGYGKPPKRTRFQKGRSGNPKGRPKGSGMRSAVEKVLARKVPISVTDPEAHVRAFGERVRDARPSVLLDHDARRPSEIDVINGAVPREAAKCGLAAPVNATLAALVRQREQRWHAAPV